MRAPKRHEACSGARLGACPRARGGAASGLLSLMAAAVLALALVPVRAEPLLTGVSFLEGAVTYSLFTGGEPEGPGIYVASLHAGMALPASTRVEVAKDSKAMLSPLPAIRYLLQPGSRAVNLGFSFRTAANGAPAFDYRLRLLSGILVGDVAGALRDVDNRIETPRGTVSGMNGHFLITVRPDGTTKYGVLRGALTVSVPGDRDYHLVADQLLTLLSDSAKLQALVPGAKPPTPGSPEQQVVAVGNSGVILGALADDPEAAQLLTEPMPEPTAALFASLPTLPMPYLLPGQNPPGYNPEFYLQQLPDFFPNEPNGGNTSGNPPVSPIFP